jgi:hypothetical protein
MYRETRDRLTSKWKSGKKFTEKIFILRGENKKGEQDSWLLARVMIFTYLP